MKEDKDRESGSRMKRKRVESGDGWSRMEK